MSYLLQWERPYEGIAQEEFQTLYEVKDWIKKNRASYDFDLDNLTLRPLVKQIDVYKLMEE